MMVDLAMLSKQRKLISFPLIVKQISISTQAHLDLSSVTQKVRLGRQVGETERNLR
jgi:hypothetical protein